MNSPYQKYKLCKVSMVSLLLAWLRLCYNTRVTGEMRRLYSRMTVALNFNCTEQSNFSQADSNIAKKTHNDVWTMYIDSFSVSVFP